LVTFILLELRVLSLVIICP